MIFFFIELQQALELKKLQTPLYEEFISNAASPPMPVTVARNEAISDVSSVTLKCRSPSKMSRRFSVAHGANVASPGSHNKYRSKVSGAYSRPLQEIQPSELNEWKEILHDAQLDSARYLYGFLSKL